MSEEDIKAARDYIEQLKSELGDLQAAFEAVAKGQAPDKRKIQFTLELMRNFVKKYAPEITGEDHDKKP